MGDRSRQLYNYRLILLLIMEFQLLNSALAQSIPEDGRIIQRTIVDEKSLEDRTVTPAQSQATTTVLYGLLAVILVIIVVIAVSLIRTNYQPKNSAPPLKKK